MSTNVLPLFRATYGPLYFSAVMSTAFYGFTCMQAFFYYVHYQHDLLPIKIFVAVLWALDTIHAALTISGVYKYILAGLVNPLSFMTGNVDFILQYLLTALLAVTTQGFFVYRIYVFSGKSIIAPLIWVALGVVELVCGTLYVAKGLYSDDTGVHVVSIQVLNSGSFEILATITLSFAAGADVLVAIVMTFLLVREWIATDFSATAHILQRLTMFAVNTGIWTAVYALLTVILLHVYPTRLLYAVFVVPLGSIYCNTLLANLNARSFFRTKRTTTRSVDTELFGTSIGPRMSLTTDAMANRQPRAVDLFSVHHEDQMDHDQVVGKAVEMVAFEDITPSNMRGNAVGFLTMQGP